MSFPLDSCTLGWRNTPGNNLSMKFGNTYPTRSSWQWCNHSHPAWEDLQLWWWWLSDTHRSESSTANHTHGCAYVMSDVMPGVPYFTSKVTFGKNGVEKVHPIVKLNEYEQKRLAQATEALKKEVASGLDD